MLAFIVVKTVRLEIYFYDASESMECASNVLNGFKIALETKRLLQSCLWN